MKTVKLATIASVCLIAFPAFSAPIRNSKKTVGIAYNTMHRQDWTQFTVRPLLAKQLGYESCSYNSNDPRVILQHGKWLADAGVDYALMDWSNDIDYIYGETKNSPEIDMIEQSVPLIFDLWRSIPKSPQIAIMLGAPDKPEAFTDGRMKRKADQVYNQFLAHKTYRKQYFHLQGKPLLVIYTGTPNPFPNGLPKFVDNRFTIRYITGFITEQPSIKDGLLSRYGYWSWEDRGNQTYTMVDGVPEFCVVTAAQREQEENPPYKYIPAVGRNGGETFKASWKRARELNVSTVLVVAWNEFFSWECQGKVELNKDIEPTEEFGDQYLKMLKDEISGFKGASVRP